MPRPKGSKNKSTLTINEQITQAAARVEDLRVQLKAAEAELKKLETLRDEEQMKTLMEAVAASGKSVSDVIAMIKGE
jgi:septal ring factor EnvC (AmiA/AmiB activator)